VGAQQSLIDELEGAIQNGSRDKRIETLRRITDLFLMTPAQLNAEQIGVFDDVLTHLVARVETKARAELAKRLAPVEQAPNEVIRRLARDEAIAVAGPVLAESKRLSTSDLIDIAQRHSQAHLLAIAGRDRIEEGVTDVLVHRGDRDVMHTLATNSGAAFSETGYSTLVKRAEGDDGLVEKLGRRLDMPPQLFRDLLVRATEAVRGRLLASARPEQQDMIRSILAEISSEMSEEAPEGRNYEDAKRLVLQLKETGRLNEPTILKLARQAKLEATIAGLAALCGVPLDLMDRLSQSGRVDGLLVPCKAAGFGWTTVRSVLEVCGGHPLSEHDATDAAAEFEKLSAPTAARVLRFWQVRQTASA
jgi:uncharacterized protein (DUF2336 family)